MRNQFLASVAVAAIAMPGAAYAQSTGTIDAEEIIVTGARTSTVEGVLTPPTPKAQTVLDQEFIGRQGAGQSILNALNVVPSVNFTNNDPYGSSGGNIRIRGFDGNRVSLTWDGVPLNDSGNYAIFSNQALDPEVIESVNVNQGTTDVDSPTASAAGGTVNYRTIKPSEDPSAFLQGSIGDFSYVRMLAVLQSGSFTPIGTQLLGTASFTGNDKFRGRGAISKQQFNGRLYQPIGSNGDFISIAGHYNQNRNNAYLALTIPQVNANYFQDFNDTCTRPTPLAAAGAAGIQNETLGAAGTCGNFYGNRTNPSNTGNIRINSRFTLTDSLTLTVDPSYQFVRATGGGQTFTQAENSALLKGAAITSPGVDLNGDGDFVDTIRLHNPSVTNTSRYGLLASLRWDFAEGQSVRIAYAYDRARHRQTGDYAKLDSLGGVITPFGGSDGVRVRAADGVALQNRDRLSYAMLNQISGEYRGKFFDNRLTVLLGVRAPFFKRDLNQFCYTIISSGNPLCSSQPVGTTPVAAPNFYIVPNGTIPLTNTGTIVANAVYAPFKASYKYNKLLPNLGLTFNVADDVTVYASYAKGFSAPRTDNLYRATLVNVQPETTDNFDAGIRYTTPRFQAVLGGFVNKFKNRIQSSFDQDTGITVDRNIGDVDIKGAELSVAVRPFNWFSFRGFGSYIDARLKADIQTGRTTFLPTKGKFLVETPEWQYGYSARATFGPVSVGGQYKHVGSRWATDVNDLRVGAYDLFDLDARVSLKGLGLEKTYFEMKVYNLFNTRYLGSINSATTAGATNTNTSYFVGSPRTVQGTVRVGF
jgi:iron complex outermembrane recepter protein